MWGGLSPTPPRGLLLAGTGRARDRLQMEARTPAMPRSQRLHLPGTEQVRGVEEEEKEGGGRTHKMRL